MRAYDDGIAFRYSIPEDAKGKKSKATGDPTEYNFAGDFTAWFYNHEQHNLDPDKLSTLKGNREPVMTVQAADNTFLALHEADLRTGEPLQFAKSGPTSFRALTAPGVIDEHIVMARQAADGKWLVGAATNEDARELEVKLDFLPPGTYQATIVQDGEGGHYQTNRETLRVEKRQASPADTLRLKLAPGGGACMMLEKSTDH